MKKKSSLRIFLKNIYGFSFFNAMLLLSPVYTVFMQDNGMTDMQLSSLFIIMSVGIFCAQIPVTWVSNKIGDKTCVMLGQVFKAAAFVLWIFCPTYLGFAVGMLLWGVQGAIYGAVYENMLYEELKARHHHDIYAKVLATRRNWSAFGSALSASGSLLLFWGYGWITLVSILALAVSMIFMFRVKVQAKKKKPLRVNCSKPKFMKLFLAGIKICTRTPCIFLMLVLCLLVENFSYLDDYLSVIGVGVGLRKEYIGVVPFFIVCCQMLGRTFACKFTHVRDWVLYAAVCAGGAIFVLFSIFYSVTGLLLLGMAYVMFSSVSILMYSRFQDFIPSNYRSVVLSLYNIGDQLTYIAVSFVIGLGGSIGSWRYSSLFVGMILIAVGLWAILFVKDKCAIAHNPNIKVLKTQRPVSSTSPAKY